MVSRGRGRGGGTRKGLLVATDRPKGITNSGAVLTVRMTIDNVNVL